MSLAIKAKELREQRGTLEAESKKLIETAEAENRDLTNEESARFKAIHEDDCKLRDRIANIEKQLKQSAELDEIDGPFDRNRTPGSAAAGDRNDPEAGSNTAHDLALRGWCRYQMGEEPTEAETEACEAVGVSVRKNSFGIELQKDFAQARRNYRNSLSTGTLSTGGVTAPPGFITNMENAMLQYGGMLQVADVMRTEHGNEMTWPTADDTGNEGEIVGESKTIGEQDVALGGVVFNAYKFTSKFVKVPRELIEDSAFDLAAWLGMLLGERIGRALNRKTTVGTGAAQPFGIVPASALGKETAGATALTFDEILDLKHSVDPAYRPGSRFMFHDNVLLVVKKLKDLQGKYLWERSTTAGEPDTIDGDPLMINQHMNGTLAAGNKTMVYGQLSKYKIRQVRTLILKRLTERFADTDEEGFVAFLRGDGNLLDAGTGPVKHLLQKAT